MRTLKEKFTELRLKKVFSLAFSGNYLYYETITDNAIVSHHLKQQATSFSIKPFFSLFPLPPPPFPVKMIFV